jgi:NAD(P)-dependent dehydrogenase (short-subunit alcohol dehydrogenase family)
MDVTRQDSIDTAVGKTISTFGQIDILINNAAICWIKPDRTRHKRKRHFARSCGRRTLGWCRCVFAKHEGKAPGQKKIEVGDAVPFGRMGTAQDLTVMAVFLASCDADYIIAQTYNIDGGQWMS